MLFNAEARRRGQRREDPRPELDGAGFTRSAGGESAEERSVRAALGWTGQEACPTGQEAVHSNPPSIKAHFEPKIAYPRGAACRGYRRRRIWLSAISSRPLPRKARVVGSGVVATMKRCSAVLGLPGVPGFQMLTPLKNELEIWPLL